MPVVFRIHPCRSAHERDEAHRIERKLAIKERQPDFWQAQKELQQLVPGLRNPHEHRRCIQLVNHRDELGRPSATVFDLGRPYITLSYVEP